MGVAQLRLGVAAPPKAFWMQYLSVILIILTFVIGVFARSWFAPRSPPQIQNQEVIEDEIIETRKPAEPILGVYSIGQLSAKNGRIENLDAYLTLLRSHDISAQIEISSTSDTAGLELILKRVGELFQSVVSQGVPEQALSIVVVEGSEASESRLVLRRQSRGF